LSGRLVTPHSQRLKLTVSIGAVKLIIPIETSQASPRPVRARSGNGQYVSSPSLPGDFHTAPAALNAVLVAVGDHKIEVIRELRNILGLGLMEGKDLVEDAPSIIAKGVSRSKAEVIKAALESVGATVSLQPHRERGNGQYAPQYAEAGHGA
jgi:ribosomal protein L7/L12